jgi:hypothetical protein
MNESTFSRLIELSYLSDAERDAALDRAQPQEVRDYLQALNFMGRLHVPEATPSKKWAGRVQLLEAVQTYHAKPGSGFVPMGWLRGLRGASAALAASSLIFVTAAAGASVTGLSGSDSALGDMLSALGLRSEEKIAAPTETPRPPVAIPLASPEADIVPPGQATNDETDDGPISASDESDDTGAPAFAPPGQDVNPPGQGGQNPGQGANPPGLDDDNPANPPGQGGQNPGQGVDPPGQGGQNPGQGNNPPGQGGENPGQGVDPPGQGGQNPGQGNNPPGQGTQDPGQGNNPPSQGGGSSDQGTSGGSGQGQGDPPGLGGENPGQGADPPGLGGDNPADPPGQGGQNPGQGH